ARRPGAPAPSAASLEPASPPLSPEEQALRAAAARQPRDSQRRMALARYLLDAGHPMEALWHFLAADEVSPADTAARIGAARALTRAGLPEIARNELASPAAHPQAGTRRA